MQKVVLYSGNMGAKQGSKSSLKRRALCLRAPTSCSCSAAAARPGRICKSVATSFATAASFPLQPVERLNELLNLADIHVLPQRGDAADLVMPSKLTGMFASGRAVIAMAREGTELHDAVLSRGVPIPPENVAALSDAIVMLADDPELRSWFGEAGRSFAIERLSPGAVLGRLDEKLKTMLGGRPSEIIAEVRQVRATEVPVTISEVEKID